MVRWILFLILSLVFIGCVEGIGFSFDPPKVEMPLIHDTNSCDYNLKDGSCLVYKKEVFLISPVLSLDVLFIIDVSYSMEPTLTKIGGAFSSLMEEISDFNWQMAFTTADHGDHIAYCENEQTNASRTGCLKGVKKEFPQEQDQWFQFKNAGNRPYYGNFMYLQSEERVFSTKILTPQLPEYDQIFYHTISRHFEYEKEDICQYPPYCQQGDHEQPLRVLKSVLAQADTTHKNFFRDKAGFVVFIVTNEEERAEDYQRATTATDVLEEFSKTFKTEDEDKDLIVYGISIQDDECLKQQEIEAKSVVSSSRMYYSRMSYSKNLSELVQKTGGANINICLDDYKKTFETISSNINDRIKKLPLQFQPVVSVDDNIAIDIIITDPQKNKEVIRFEGNVQGQNIIFPQNLKLGSRVEVKYYYEKPSI